MFLTRYCPLLSGNTCLQNVWYIYISWISGFPILAIYKFYPYLSEMFFFWERENVSFFFICIVWTTIRHTALMYILLQQSWNLIFNIPTLFCWYISSLNQTCLISTTTLLRTHIHKNNITRNEKSFKEKRQVFFCLWIMSVIFCIIHPYLISMVCLLQLFSFNKSFIIMFKILMLSKITIILTTIVNNTDNVHVNDVA